MSRRNSFSRDAAAEIAQCRLRSFDKAVKSPESPRKTASFSHLATLHESTLATSPMRSAHSAFQFDRSDNDQLGSPLRMTAATAAQHEGEDSDDGGEDDDCDAVPLDFLECDDLIHDDRALGASSPCSSVYSPVSLACKTDDGVIGERPQDPPPASDQVDVNDSKTPSSSPCAVSANSVDPQARQHKQDIISESAGAFAEWLEREHPRSPLALSQSVQQIEHEIRSAVDSAATRVSHTLERRAQFDQQLSVAAAAEPSTNPASGFDAAFKFDAINARIDGSKVASNTTTHGGLNGTDGNRETDIASGISESDPPEPELLLLMEVLIGDGRSETIEIHVGEQPEALATAFAAKHSLISDTIPRLTQHIQDQLDAINEEDMDKDSPPLDDQEGEACTEYEYCNEDLDGEPTCSAYKRNEQSSHLHMPKPRSPVEEQDPMSPPLPPVFTETNAPTTWSLGEASNDMYSGEDSDYRHHEKVDKDMPNEEKQQRNYEREHKYNTLMEKYGHYTSHSGKVDPTNARPAATIGSSNRTHSRHNDHKPNTAAESPPSLTMQNVGLAQHARLMFASASTRNGNSGSHSTGTGKAKLKDTVFHRLHSLAESRDKWLQRQQKSKAREEEKLQAQRKLELSSKSRDLIAARGTGGYVHIGERLYDEGLSDMAKRARNCEQGVLEKQHEVNWTCPRCAFSNHARDTVCKNVIAAGRGLRHKQSHTMLAELPEAICGHARPTQLFRPTLLSPSASGAPERHASKLRSTRAQSQRQQRNQQAIEDEFRETCPFRPTINAISSEIMRDKLESEARTAGVAITTTADGEIRRKNAHIALYEDAFQVRAHREALEQEEQRRYSFKPDIGVNALWVNEDGGLDARSKIDDVVERLAVTKFQELERKRSSLHTKYAPDRDPVTGRPYFKPETGRGPIFNRNERGLPIGEFLHESRKERDEYHRMLRQQEADHIKQQSQQGFVSQASKQALEARKVKTFGRVFDYLCRMSEQHPVREPQGEGGGSLPPQDDDTPRSNATQDQVRPTPATSSSTSPSTVAVVEPKNVDLNALPPDIARIVRVVFAFANDEAITRADFDAYMDQLMVEIPGLTHTQILFLAESLPDGKSSRRTVEPAKDADAEDRELTFHPAIDKNSDHLATKHGRAQRSKVFHALNKYYEHYQERRQLTQKQLDRELARTCPFQPTFVTNSRKTRGAAFYDKLKHKEAGATSSQASLSLPLRREIDPQLRTTVVNARPYVRPIDSTAQRSRANTRSPTYSGSSASAPSDEEEDDALTDRVLAALDEHSHLDASTTSSATNDAATRTLLGSFRAAPVAVAPVTLESCAQRDIVIESLPATEAKNASSSADTAFNINATERVESEEAREPSLAELAAPPIC